MKRRTKYIISLTVALLAVTICLIFTYFIPAKAATAINSDVDKFKYLTGDAAYINYADNYYLDMEDPGLIESINGYTIMNVIANLLFTFVRWLAKTVVTLFYYCMDFDLAALFSEEINTIQGALNRSVFKPLFTLAFCGAAVHMIKNILKRDVVGSMLQVAKVIGVLVLSILVVNYSATVISYATGITKGFSASILLSVNNEEEVTDSASYAAQSAGTLWVNMIHQPWVFIEFGNDAVTETTINKLLCVGAENQIYAVGSKTREKFVDKEYVGTAFAKTRAGEKAGFMLIYLFPFVIKSVIYLVLAVMSLGFQLIAVLYVLLAPVVLLLIMVPGFEGLLTSWLKKLLETQLSVLMISLIMGMLMAVDDLLFTKCAAAWGWLVVLIVQTLIGIIVILKRNEILGALGNLQNGSIRTGRMLKNTANNIPMYATHRMGRATLNAGKKIGGATLKAGKRVGQASFDAGKSVVKAAGTMAYTAGATAYEYGKLAAGDEASTGRAAVKHAAMSYDVNVGATGTRKTVERPILDPQKIVNVRPVNGHLEKAAPEKPVESAQKPQTAAKRPRMDKVTAAPIEPRKNAKTESGQEDADVVVKKVGRPRISTENTSRQSQPQKNRTKKIEITIPDVDENEKVQRRESIKARQQSPQAIEVEVKVKKNAEAATIVNRPRIPQNQRTYTKKATVSETASSK